MHDSSIGLGHQPFTLVRRVRFPYRVPKEVVNEIRSSLTVCEKYSQYIVKRGDVAEWSIATDCKSVL